MKSKKFFCIASLSTLLFSANVSAQDSNLLAYESSQKDTISSVDDDINAALEALNEVNAILETKTPTETDKDNKIDVEAIIAAANAPEPAKPETKPVIEADKAPEVQAAPAKTEIVQEQTAQKEVKPEPIPEPEKQETKPVIAANDKAPNVQTAPTKAEKTQEQTAKTEIKPETVPEKQETKPVIAANDKAPNVQTAPTKAEKTQEQTAKTEVKPVSVPEKQEAKPVIAANNKAPNVQTAPTKAEKVQEQTAKVDVKPEPAKVPQTNLAANNTKSNNIAPDGTHVTTKPQTAAPSPNPSTAPHTLSMSYVMAIYKLNGVDLSSIKSPMPTIGELYQHAFTHKLVYQSTKPAIGDLAFFHNTVDRNRDGRWNDWHTLIGIVESIDQDETITILTYQTNKIERIQLNLKYPELQKGKKGQTLNTQIRPNEGAQKGTTAKLFAGFANLLGNASSVTVIDNWTPGMKLSK